MENDSIYFFNYALLNIYEFLFWLNLPRRDF
jgi:hypothetical protein